MDERDAYGDTFQFGRLQVGASLERVVIKSEIMTGK